MENRDEGQAPADMVAKMIRMAAGASLVKAMESLVERRMAGDIDSLDVAAIKPHLKACLEAAVAIVKMRRSRAKSANQDANGS